MSMSVESSLSYNGMDAKIRQPFRPSRKKPRPPFSQKTFLRAVQVLEDLRVHLKGIKNPETDLKSHAKYGDMFYHHKTSSENYKKLHVYYSQLKTLLCEWYLLALKKESANFLWQSSSFFDKFWILAESETENLSSLTRVQHSAFLDDTFISVSNLKKVSETLRSKFQDQVTVLRGFNNAVNILDSGYLFPQHHLVQKMISESTVSNQKLYVIVSFCINANLHKFYHIDPSNVSTEFVSIILWMCESFSKFFDCKSKGRYECHLNKCLRNYCSPKDPAPFFGMLSGLASFQAKLACEKFVQSLSSAVYAERNKLNDVDSLEVLSSRPGSTRRTPDGVSTSDYYSVSTSEADVLGYCAFNLSTIREQLSEVSASILSRNQSLVLKIVCAVKNIGSGHVPNDSAIPLNGSSSSKETHCTWKRHLLGNDIQTGRLEKIYWSTFWEKITNDVFGMLLETPGQHFSDHSNCLGSILVLKESYSSVIAVVLMSLVEFTDISPDFVNSIKRVHFSLLSFLSRALWDKQMCVALKATTRHQCEAVPLAFGKIGNKVGNVFSLAFQSTSIVFRMDCVSRKEISLAVQSTDRMVCCLDAFHSWAIVKGKAYLSSWDIPSCLLIAYSDVLNDHELSSFSQHWQVKLHEKPFFMCDRFNNSWNSFIATFKQVKELPEEIIYYFQEKVKVWVMRDLFKERNYYMRKITGCRQTSDLGIEKIIKDVLNPVYLSAKGVPEDHLVHFMEAFVNAAVQAYVEVCRRRYKSFIKPYMVRVPESDLSELMFWIETLDLPDAAKDALETVPSVQKLTYLSSAKRYSSTFSFLRSRRRVRPV